MKTTLHCVICKNTYSDKEIRYTCDCGEMLEVKHDITLVKEAVAKSLFTKRLQEPVFPYMSGVWRYKELVSDSKHESIISRPEGNTRLYTIDNALKNGFSALATYVGLSQIFLKHEGENPTGSFKDRGMTIGMSKAKELGVRMVACASTGNTSSSLASYASQAGIPSLVFIPSGKVASGKLAQTIAYGARVVQIHGDFDKAMQLVQEVCQKENIYLLNSINPFRIEGQKTIALELLQQLGWNVPDWIILPAGNLGNTSAIGKALVEAKEIGLIRKLPRIAAIQATGANPFYRSFKENFAKRHVMQAETVASAIRIGNPVSFEKAKRIILETNGVVEEVTDAQILDAKAVVDRSGIGCEPASAATVAGMKKLVERKIIKKSDVVAGILTGSMLKDPDTIIAYHKGSYGKAKFANSVTVIEPTLDAVKRLLQT